MVEKRTQTALLGRPSFMVRGLTKSYMTEAGEIHALRGVDLDLHEGEFLVLLGPSGSGKSTFLNILGGLDQPSSGQILFRGEEMAGYTERELTLYRRGAVGFVFQLYNLIPSLTAVENVAIATEIARNPLRPEAALELVGLGHRLNHFPAELSGGEQQRVAVARAIAKRPDVLLCDEPTGALDSRTGIVVLEAIARASETLGATTVLITHNAVIGGMADRVVHFADGRVAAVKVNERRLPPEGLSLVKRGLLSALDIKLFRDLWRMRAQALAILLVTAAGSAAFVTQLGILHSLEQTVTAYYEHNRFADLFANVRRAPNSRLADLAAIPGVKKVTPRIVYNAVLDIAGLDEPVNGLIVSQPRPGLSELNDVYIRRGRLVQPGAVDEVVLSETFADANKLDVGSQFWASIKGHRRQLRVVGIGLSPEYIFFGVPGAMVPDDRRFGVMWMDHDVLEAAFDMRGAFDDVAMALMPGVDQQEVVRRVDSVLDQYGGVGAYLRKDHVSHATLDGDIQQLRSSIQMAAPLFLGVVAFLLNMLMMRQVETERTHIGVLKAFGYTNFAVASHYAKMVLTIIAAGVALGLVGGAWLGHAVTQIYVASYHFPSLEYVITPSVFVQAAAVQLGAALIGGFGSLRKAVLMPPAVAMRPPPPPIYKRSLIERLGLRLFGDQPTRMILRHLLRWPMRSGLTITGIALATTLLVAPLSVLNTATHMVTVHFFSSERQDLTIAFAQTRGQVPSIDAMEESPGVLQAEPFRATMANIKFGTKERRITVLGMKSENELARPILASLDPLLIPRAGVVLSSTLAAWLGVSKGDYVELDFKESRRPKVSLPVTAIALAHVGLTFFMVHMDLDRLNDIMDDGDVISGVRLRVDPLQQDALYTQLKLTPSITGVVSHTAQLEAMHRIMAQTKRMTLLFIAFASLIVFGVVYNSARIALAERARELATMRMLGFFRMEVSYILLGELAMLTIAAVPPGCLGGYLLAWKLTEGTSNEMFRLPLFVTKASFGYGILVITLTVLISGLAVAWRVFRFDLIGILKIRE